MSVTVSRGVCQACSAHLKSVLTFVRHERRPLLYRVRDTREPSPVVSIWIVMSLVVVSWAPSDVLLFRVTKA